MPPQPGYVYTPPADDPLVTAVAVGPPLPGADSVDAADMRRALVDYHEALVDPACPKPPPKPALDLTHVHATAMRRARAAHGVRLALRAAAARRQRGRRRRSDARATPAYGAPEPIGPARHACSAR